ncbi:MAG: hypothetical protein Q9209_002704 [Squamulea sp. 1 TL-2023]
MSMTSHIPRYIHLPPTRTFTGTLRALRRATAPPCTRGSLYIRRFAHNPAEEANFTSIVDNSPDLVKSGRRHGPGIIILGNSARSLVTQYLILFRNLALIPITAFALGTWQVFRLGWKTELIARFEDRLIKPPLPLPPRIDPEAIKDFDYRKVYTTGRLCHEQEMLIGPRIHDGNDGFLVVTPLEREDGASTVLVNRGWIPRNKKSQADRKEGLPLGQVTVEGLLREPWKKNVFTPENRPELGQFYFPDVKQMAELTRSEAVWIEETMSNLLLDISRYPASG